MQKFIPDLFHARLHKYNKKLVINKMQTVPEFKDNNREVLNEIYKELKAQFPELTYKQHKQLIEKGIKNYLEAEGVYG